MPSPILDIYEYVYDETAVLPENLITNEERAIDGTMDTPAIALRYGSFYTESVSVRDEAGNPLTFGVDQDYIFGLFNATVTEKTGHEAAYAIVILNPAVRNKCYVDYQVVGGPFGASAEILIDLYKNLQDQNPTIAWRNIIGKPDGFKPAHHLQDIGDLFGAEYFVNALDRLGLAILTGDNASHTEIWNAIDALAQSTEDSINQLRDQLTDRIDALESRLDDWITALEAKVDTHIADKNNPHETTAHQTGTYTSEEIDEMLDTLTNWVENNFTQKDNEVQGSFRVYNSQLQSYVGSSWNTVWPPKWQ